MEEVYGRNSLKRRYTCEYGRVRRVVERGERNLGVSKFIKVIMKITQSSCFLLGLVPVHEAEQFL